MSCRGGEWCHLFMKKLSLMFILISFIDFRCCVFRGCKNGTCLWVKLPVVFSHIVCLICTLSCLNFCCCFFSFSCLGVKLCRWDEYKFWPIFGSQGIGGVLTRIPVYTEHSTAVHFVQCLSFFSVLWNCVKLRYSSSYFTTHWNLNCKNVLYFKLDFLKSF